MAHECPECGQVCYCHGDIDDCCFNFPEDVWNCTHCDGKDDEDEELLEQCANCTKTISCSECKEGY